MSYSKILNEIILNSNFTQKQISNKCKELNVPISREKINKILNGKASAPEEKVSRAIAKICNEDDRELVIEGYLENAPKEFIEFLNKFQDLLFEIGISFYESNFSKEQIEIIKEAYRKETLSKIVIAILDFENIPEFDNIKIDNEMDYTKAFNNLFENFNCIKMEDDSMENMIPKNSKLKLKLKEKYKNGDIVLVKVRKEKNPIVRIIFYRGRDVCLYAMNRKYHSLYLHEDEYQIISAITSIEINV